MPHADKYEVATLCDLDETRLNAVADEFSISGRTRSSDELMADPEIDIIDICTPPAIHTKLVLQALEAGKHVVCEKPLTGSLAEVDQVRRAEKEAKGLLMPIFQYRYGDGASRQNASSMRALPASPMWQRPRPIGGAPQTITTTRGVAAGRRNSAAC